MPARTLPSSPDPALSPPRFQIRPSPPAHPSSHPHRDVNDNRLEPSPYAPAMPPNARPDPDYSSPSWSPPQPRVYPDPASIPPHWQVHPALTQLRPGEGRAYVPANPALQGTSRVPWQNPYTRPIQFQPVVAPPPPPIPHKVWILDCKGCGTFLTNRGMKAVLLLRPNVPLYSTDALPINCSAFSPEVEGPGHAPSTSTSSTASFAGPSRSPTSPPSAPSNDASQPGGASDRPPTRTCECLTQTLCCHGCGNAVGYIIVTPCQRCTSSITVNNRATNGHRFVFYSSEITACERHYVPGERGVSRFHPPAPTTSLVQAVQAGLSGLTITTPPRSSVAQQQPSPSSPSTPMSMPPLSPGPAIPGRRTSIDYLPTPPPEVDNPFALPSRPIPGVNAATPRSPRASITTGSPSAPNFNQSRSGPLQEARQAMPPVPPNSHTTSPYTGTTAANPAAASAQLQTSPAPLAPSRARAASTSAALSPSTPAPSASAPALHVHLLNGSPVFLRGPLYSLQPIQPPAQPAPPEPIKAGEVLYWHHLMRSGEIPAVAEDPRARVSRLGAGAGEKGIGSGRRNTIPSGVVAGR